ncbi:hypothetical protein [Micromonospora sp. LH3U1]|uniref:hypothetical protein n=1 Tax=Micromonospora sp. LH3U1 TaxID=3018339 RepID=UPI00234B46FD|nr:hypothetical protein [Micromonospora sp. LH3U1]WCN84843.1 hypothetical protein PCA76_21090 [Micromonospora sp. LH3U1]
MTRTEWTGNVAAYAVYNYTSRNAEITWGYTYLGKPLTGKPCATPGWGETRTCRCARRR